ncbi:MAG: hypothetical protein O2856_07730 [Planctomycetota bacterium]|nr:hypothetical protein [Planctomycetota bacterium]
MTELHRHILLSSMGVRPSEATYTLAGVERTSRFSALALWELIPEANRPTEIWFLLTPQAEAGCWEAIQQDAATLGIAVEPVRISADSADDTREFLEATARSIPQGVQLTLDVTQGLRHHAFLFYALALYLTEFRGVSIRGAWYCRMETEEREAPKPVIDLKPVLDLARWFHALAVFRETGSLREVGQLMDPGETRSLVDDLSFFFLNGMPLEAGNAASRLIQAADGRQLPADLPLASELQELILAEIRPLAGPTFVANPKSGETAKKAVPLDDEELQRQAEFIVRYFRTGQHNLGFGLLREWIVNRLVDQNSASTAWLERVTREQVERALGGLGIVIRNKAVHQPVRDLLTDQQQEWAKRWNSVCDIRNALQHHGMKPAVFEPHRGDIAKAVKDFDGREGWSEPGQFGGGHGRLLICPIGLTPGVLYSAISHVQPDRVIVICSQSSSSAIDDAVARSGRPVEVMRLTMSDPYCGIDEFKSLVMKAAVWLYEADDVRANLTGGTTLMGVLAGELVKRASREYQRPLREFVLIDKRPPELQRTDPWQRGDIHFLDGQPPSEPDVGVTDKGEREATQQSNDSHNSDEKETAQ